MQRGIAAACVCLGACLFPSLDGLSGSDGGGDAMLDAADATAETSVDAGADVRADAIADAVADTAFSCTKTDARFCDDFDDEDAGPFAHWSSSYSGTGAYFARAPSDASPPNASQFESFGWQDSSTPPYAILEKDFVNAITSSAKLLFDLRVDHWPTNATAYFNTGDLSFGGTNGGGTNLVLRQPWQSRPGSVTGDIRKARAAALRAFARS